MESLYGILPTKQSALNITELLLFPVFKKPKQIQIGFKVLYLVKVVVVVVVVVVVAAAAAAAAAAAVVVVAAAAVVVVAANEISK
ncbi:hypothetical protein ElyMa_003922500 [Elysia marginata]|uniref:Uncharacterized protein n=1 Tax=Elysia marginata TaxID=1093978 RepID=A0AAV4FPX4_9GAST|nr:hypothetical protein ElyMa_003922500 [Elysia marginata]